jgi:putative transcriptional regulator
MTYRSLSRCPARPHGCERCTLQGDQGGGGYECAGRCCFSDPGMHVVSDGSVLSIQPEPYRGRVPIIVNLDVMLARRKMRSKELAERIGITEQNVSLLKSGKVRGVRFDTLARICAVLECQPGDVLEYRSDTTDLAGEQDI